MRSLRDRLALIFFAIILTAIAGIYLYVAPQLESSLRNQKLRSLAAAANGYSASLTHSVGTSVDKAGVTRAVRQAADRSGARVSLFGVSQGTQGVQTYPIADSTAKADTGGADFPAAMEAARTGQPTAATEGTTTGPIGEAARPLFFRGRVARVAVYSSPLGEVQRSVALIRRQVAIAGGVALMFALLASYMVARALSRRVKRLEKAAEEVADGRFTPIPVDSNDEQRQLAQLDSARKRFIATASHELRTPIFSLGGFVELLQGEELDEETRQQFLGQIRDQLDRLRTLTTELLDLSKLEAGSLELRREPTDLGEVARKVTAEFTPALVQHDSHLQLRLERSPIRTVCDRERLAQIMRILIDNALAHTPDGTQIRVTAAQANGNVTLAVRDDGLGIRRDVLPRVFEPFYSSGDAQGSGLGLAIARELAEQMDGRLGVESVPGRTTFTLELPT